MHSTCYTETWCTITVASSFGSTLLAGVFLIITGLLVFTSASPIITNFNYVVDDDWDSTGTLSDYMETDGEKIYPEPTETGTWTSGARGEEDTSSVYMDVQSDMSDGNGEVRLNGYTDRPDSSTEPNETFDRELESGDNSFDFNDENLTDYDYFDVEIELTEDDNSDNERPNVESLEYGFSSVNPDFLNPRKPLTEILGLLVTVMGVLAVLTGAFKA